jgi:P-type E1-E2 ATPase
MGIKAGDIIFLKDGEKIPADVRILHCSDGMEVDNSALTGESMPATREAVTEKSGQPEEARNLAFFGTMILKGKATCVVHATGDSTFLGKIAQGINTGYSKSTLEIQIEHFIHIIACVAIIVGLLSLAANLKSRFDQYLGFLAFLSILTLGFWLMIFLLTFVIPYWLIGALKEFLKERKENKSKELSN